MLETFQIMKRIHFSYVRVEDVSEKCKEPDKCIYEKKDIGIGKGRKKNRIRKIHNRIVLNEAGNFGAESDLYAE